MKSLAILHEGNAKSADRRFIESMIAHLGMDLNQVEFYGMGVKSNFFKLECTQYARLQQLFAAGVLEKLLFIADADDIKNDAVYGGLQSTGNGLNEIIGQLGFDGIASFFVMCDPVLQIGYLESFILSTIPDEQKSCIQAFLSCSNFSSKDNHKAILNQIYNLAYPHAPYDFTHAHFDKLKQQLRNLFSSD
jgi:hypothetical protein